jgi:hypothetical protein
MQAIKALLLEKDDDVHTISKEILHKADLIIRFTDDEQEIEIIKNRFTKKGVFYYLYDAKQKL